MSKWISVKTGIFPAIGDIVQIYSDNREIGTVVGYFEDDHKWHMLIPTESRAITLNRVTHWQPLPLPPEK